MLSCVCIHCLTMSSTHENESMTFKATTTFCVRTATAASISSNANQVWNINLTFCYFCTEWNEEGKMFSVAVLYFMSFSQSFFSGFCLACLMLWWIFFLKKNGMKIYFIYNFLDVHCTRPHIMHFILFLYKTRREISRETKNVKTMWCWCFYCHTVHGEWIQI